MRQKLETTKRDAVRTVIIGSLISEQPGNHRSADGEQSVGHVLRVGLDRDPAITRVDVAMVVDGTDRRRLERASSPSVDPVDVVMQCVERARTDTTPRSLVSSQCTNNDNEYVYSPMKATHIHRDIKVYKIDRGQNYTQKRKRKTT